MKTIEDAIIVILNLVLMFITAVIPLIIIIWIINIMANHYYHVY